MATAAIAGAVLTVNVGGDTPLRLDMSLQRHSYRHCGTGAAAVANSLLHASVTDATMIAEGIEVGDKVEELLKKAKGSWKALFGKTLTVTSKRTYLIDNSGLNPNGSPNHFFVTGGPDVWAGISAADYAAARDIRLLELAIAARRQRSDTYDYLNPKKLLEKEQETGGTTNPVVVAVRTARTSLRQASADDTTLIAASGSKDVVELVRTTL
ncbi:hypothetical protein GCM10010329_45330 [Streptomyces spiroverticillatus]|uniref:Uncharacterized protein n=1 Tax=Streptomyces finlayi TaxID=67296 RepID=A0A919CBJ9_9ACTN|nr:hypothetical protein [Streptomyces finlayi]GHA17207.1 hypothetical protein GCM10010329_45330 [Streptomyces spiroverticillatus]GHC99199.1 hypothetical protein GCM10010334_42500 [Streptomyces finlayi]